MKTQTQTQTKHTPGPWTTDHGHIWANGGVLLATMKERCVESLQKGAVQYAPQQANAALIASAPDLLAALRCAVADLEGIMPEFEPSGDRTHSGWISINEALQAIAKAEGGEG